MLLKSLRKNKDLEGYIQEVIEVNKEIIYSPRVLLNLLSKHAGFFMAKSNVYGGIHYHIFIKIPKYL